MGTEFNRPLKENEAKILKELSQRYCDAREHMPERSYRPEGEYKHTCDICGYVSHWLVYKRTMTDVDNAYTLSLEGPEEPF